MSAVVAVPKPPFIVCPAWCTVSQEEHVAELTDWDGLVVHWSSDREANGFTARLGCTAFPDGTPDPRDPTTIRTHIQPEGLSLDATERYARTLLSLVKEARA